MDERRARDVLPSLIAVAITFIVLDTFFLMLRFISRTLFQSVDRPRRPARHTGICHERWALLNCHRYACIFFGR